jgi:glyoxylase-like metal-dependent hydrolase (beta-lactamase superfamily II)
MANNLGHRTWRVGTIRVTSVIEDQTDHIPPQMFFPASTPDAVAAHTWLVPHYADEAGNIGLRVQAFVLQTATRTIVVDPCVGNGKTLSLPFWNNQQYAFMERFREADFDPADVDLVVHTHLHEDHVGWDTHEVNGRWVPTFVNARHLYTQAGLDHVRAGTEGDRDATLRESIQPVFEAGLADIVDEHADLGEGLRLVATPGHMPGHVSLWIESDDERALISGDFVHHHVQLAEPSWAEVADIDTAVAEATRRRMFGEVTAAGAMFFGTHFPTHSVDRLMTDGAVWRFVPTD